MRHSLPVSLHSSWDYLLGAYESLEIVVAVLRYLQASSVSLYQCPKERKLLRIWLKCSDVLCKRTSWWPSQDPHLLPAILSLKSPSRPQSIQQPRQPQHPCDKHTDSISIPIRMLLTLQKPDPQQVFVLQCHWSHTDVFHFRDLIEDFVGSTWKLSPAQRSKIVRNNYQTHSNFLAFDYSLFSPLFWDK